MTPVNQEMLVDAVNSNDVPVGVVARGELFQRHVNFRVAHDLIFNSHGELLLQKLAPQRLRHPGYWGSSVAAYLFAGESYLDAAERRLTQELGVHNASLEFIGKISMVDDGCQKFVSIFTGLYDGPFSVDTEQIEELEFLSLRQIHILRDSGARFFTPTFLKVLEFYESKMQ